MSLAVVNLTKCDVTTCDFIDTMCLMMYMRVLTIGEANLYAEAVRLLTDEESFEPMVSLVDSVVELIVHHLHHDLTSICYQHNQQHSHD